MWCIMGFLSLHLCKSTVRISTIICNKPKHYPQKGFMSSTTNTRCACGLLCYYSFLHPCQYGRSSLLLVVTVFVSVGSVAAAVIVSLAGGPAYCGCY